MQYDNIARGTFLCRPNRFLAHVELDGAVQLCHVKNTGRCRELLVPGAPVLIQESSSPARKTRWDLVSVWKGDRLINMDSSAPNRLFAEWVQAGNLFDRLTLLKPEQRFGASRFDFYLEGDGRRGYAEVKGVTLEQDGIARFPDAPTERGVKHLRELIACREAGFEAWVAFIVQMKGVTRLEPNRDTHAAFGDALRDARDAGVHILALDCRVTPGEVWVDQVLPVML